MAACSCDKDQFRLQHLHQNTVLISRSVIRLEKLQVNRDAMQIHTFQEQKSNLKLTISFRYHVGLEGFYMLGIFKIARNITTSKRHKLGGNKKKYTIRSFSLWEVYNNETSVELLHVCLLTGSPAPASVLKSGDTWRDWSIT